MKKNPLPKIIAIMALTAIFKLFDLINIGWYVILLPVWLFLGFLAVVFVVAIIRQKIKVKR